MAKADGHNVQCTMDNVQWKKVKLGEVGEINPSNKEQLPNQFIYIDLESVVAGELLTEKLINKKDAPSRAQRIVYKDDVLYQTVRPYQKNNYIHKKEGDYVASTGYALIRCYKEYYPNFLYYKLHTHQVESVVLGLCTGTSYPAIAPNYLKKIEISVPSLPAQHRIAAILSSADKVIEQTRQLIGKYKSIKQGMMEDLLKPKEGWKKVRLGDCLKQKPDYGINAPAVPYDNHFPTYLRITDITEDGYYSKKDIVSVANPEAWKYIMEEGDLVFARTGASVGKTYLYNPNDGVLVFAGFLIRVKANEDVLLPEFFKYQTQTPQYKNWIAANSMRTGQPGINGNEYEEYTFYMPHKNGKPDIIEQRRIAKILLGIDRKIEAEEKVLEKYEKMKKGLMERLLNE